MADETIHPALADDQWPFMQEVVASHPSGKLGWYVMARRDGDTLELDIHGPDKQWKVDDPHALAALCLYGRPEGFTQEDVRRLDTLLEDGQLPMTVAHAEATGLTHEWLLSLIARIAALLPPDPEAR